MRKISKSLYKSYKFYNTDFTNRELRKVKKSYSKLRYLKLRYFKKRKYRDDIMTVGGIRRRRRKANSTKSWIEAKQRLRNFYWNITSRQYKNLIVKAKIHRKTLGKVFFGLLETRLDVIVFRMSYKLSMHEVRQWILHGFVLVNGKVVDRIGRQVLFGDIVSFNLHKPIVRLLLQQFSLRRRRLSYHQQRKIRNITRIFFNKPRIKSYIKPYIKPYIKAYLKARIKLRFKSRNKQVVKLRRRRWIMFYRIKAKIKVVLKVIKKRLKINLVEKGKKYVYYKIKVSKKPSLLFYLNKIWIGLKLKYKVFYVILNLVHMYLKSNKRIYLSYVYKTKSLLYEFKEKWNKVVTISIPLILNELLVVELQRRSTLEDVSLTQSKRLFQRKVIVRFRPHFISDIFRQKSKNKETLMKEQYIFQRLVEVKGVLKGKFLRQIEKSILGSEIIENILGAKEIGLIPGKLTLRNARIRGYKRIFSIEAWTKTWIRKNVTKQIGRRYGFDANGRWRKKWYKRRYKKKVYYTMTGYLEVSLLLIAGLLYRYPQPKLDFYYPFKNDISRLLIMYYV